MATVDVEVDHRENTDSKSGTVYTELFEEEDRVDSVETRELEIGDFIVNDEVVFERKTPSDFVGSMKNQRLEDQISRMYEEFGPENSYLLIEGNIHEFEILPYTQMSANSVFGFIGSVSARWQMVPLFCSNEMHLVNMVVKISRKRFEDADRVVRGPQSTPSKTSDTFLLRALTSLDGIGRETAKSIESEFDSLFDLTTASMDDLEKIDGIGSSRSEQVVKQIRGDYDG